jgi:hypothetical protein
MVRITTLNIVVILSIFIINRHYKKSITSVIIELLFEYLKMINYPKM